MAIGFALVWVSLWLAFYLYELRSPREEEFTASFIIATTVSAVAVLVVVAMALIGWAAQHFVPIFG